MFELSLVHRQLLAAGIAAAVVLAVASQGDDAVLERGRELFDKNFHRADGLGAPEFNANSCRACHQDPVLGGAGPLELNVSRCGNDNGGAGPFTNVPGGQAISKLRMPHVPWREEASVEADCFEQRNTPSLLGLGLVEGVPDAAILANEDPDDLDGDGIRGVARRVTINGVTEIGRFGWKSQIPTLLDFVSDACIQELGITTPDDGRGFAIAVDADGVPDPELNHVQIANLHAFMASLPAPQRKGSTDPRVAQGEQLFTEIGCAKCHVPVLQAVGGPVPLFSDLLLHNVMPAGFRGMAEPGAPVGAYRTPPLWGIGDTAPYLHDGRAENLEQAILGHFGEADGVRAAFAARSAEQREALLLFLQDL